MILDPEPMTEEEVTLFSYAVGILAGLGHKYGAHDVTIYHGDIRIRIERTNEDTHDDVEDAPCGR